MPDFDASVNGIVKLHKTASALKKVSREGLAKTSTERERTQTTFPVLHFDIR